MGVLHHLSDDDAKVILSSVRSQLKPSGRLITLDPCFTEPQNPIARFLIKHDRGCNVRTPEQYSKLVGDFFQ